MLASSWPNPTLPFGASRYSPQPRRTPTYIQLVRDPTEVHTEVVRPEHNLKDAFPEPGVQQADREQPVRLTVLSA